MQPVLPNKCSLFYPTNAACYTQPMVYQNRYVSGWLHCPKNNMNLCIKAKLTCQERMQLFICYISCFSYSCLAEKPNIFRWMQPWQARFLWGELDYSIFGKWRQRRKSQYKRSKLEPGRGVSLYQPKSFTLTLVLKENKYIKVLSLTALK